MQFSNEPFLCPRPKSIRFEDGASFYFQRKNASGKAVYPFKNKVLVRTLTSLFGKAPDPQEIQILCQPDAVKAPCNAEQAYYLDVYYDGISILGNTEIGLLYALQALKQLKTGEDCFRCAKILDWPDQELRICARPLLCGEGNRSALAWGDGRQEEIKRWRNEIDFALSCRYNGIFVHGFTWNTQPYPNFAKEMRALNRYARERGVTLIFGGYGIGKGGWGGEAYIAEAHNFLPGAGHNYQQDYPCSWNDIRTEKSAYNGTCRSNQDLRREKFREIREFIQQIEPGALYIHHEDQSEFYAETQPFFWDKRCEACRKKWPNDALEKVDGGAGAIADGYDVFCEARASVKNKDYDASKDCRILLASPCYGAWYNSPDEWSKVEELWVNISRSMKYGNNVYFVMREQFSDCEGGEGRLQRLSRLINEAGCAQKLMVFFVSGGALYGENAVFSSLPSLNSLVVGGNGAIFNFSGVLFQRPQQLFNSECSWNANYRPGGETIALDDRERQGIKYRERMAKRDFIDQRHLVPDGFLAKCCKLIYGDRAGKYIFRYQTLRTAHGDGPLALLYQQTVMEKLFRKLNSEPNPNANPGSLSRPVLSYEDAALRWEEQVEITRQGTELISNAMTSVEGWLEKELRRQAAQLRIGTVFAELIGKIYRCLDGVVVPKSTLLDMVKRLRVMMHRLPHEYPITEDGDGALYEKHLENLTEFIEGMKQ